MTRRIRLLSGVNDFAGHMPVQPTLVTDQIRAMVMQQGQKGKLPPRYQKIFDQRFAQQSQQ